MANILPILFSLFVLQTSSKAAPSDDDSFISTYTEEGSKLDNVPKGVVDHSINENESENNQRQKRLYDYIGLTYSRPELATNFPYPALNLPFLKRDERQNTDAFGAGDAISKIFRRLQEIANTARQNAQVTPQQTPIPTFIPFLYLPPVGCDCTTTSEVPSKPARGNDKPQPKQNTTVPDLKDRIALDDTRQNWGEVVRSTISNLDVYEDGNRPISFDPIIPEKPLDVPIPPVEHGSVQAGAEPQSIPISRPIPNKSVTNKPVTNKPATNKPIAPQNANRFPVIEPTNCDRALVSCCIGRQGTPNCFVQQDCSDSSIYGKHCEPRVVLEALKKIEIYYEQTLG